MRCVLLTIAVLGCDRTPKAVPAPTAPEDAAPSIAPPAVPAPEISVAREKTSKGGEVIAIGAPRMQVTQHRPYGLAARLSTKRAFAVDRDEVKVFELDGGTLIGRYEVPPISGDATIDLAVSPDGRWLAMERLNDAAVRETPFVAEAFRAPLWPWQFSADSKVLLGEKDGAFVAVEVVRGGPTAGMPGQTALYPNISLAMGQLDGKAYWIRASDAVRWDRAKNTVTTFARATAVWSDARIAARAAVAVVGDEKTLYRLDLASGALAAIGPREPRFAVSPSGDRVAIGGMQEVRVVETRGGKELARIQVANLRELQFSDDEATITYIDGQSVRVHDLATGLRAFPGPARFGGWLAGDRAAIVRNATTQQLAIKTRALSPAVVNPSAPPAGAPSWATWVSARPDGAVVAAEPSMRHALPAYRRGEVDCEDKLRVWTAKGGERTFTLVQANTVTDACWELAGGYVIAATAKRIVVYDPVTGKRVAALDPGDPPKPITDDALAHEYWSVTASPTGTHLALLWRRADVWGPSQPIDPRSHGDLGHVTKLACESDQNFECKREYFVEVWSLAGTPKRVWQDRLSSKRPTSRTWPLPKVASGPIAFTHDGTHVLFGFDDGDIVIRGVTDPKQVRVETLHRAPLARIEVSPDNRYVFSEDAEGEQRIWPL